jgi:radical SAM superfamily enzyme YgiQ (UPF0313 family)
MKLLFLRPYFGVAVHSDMHGDLGIADYLPVVYPDISFVTAATIASKNPSVDLHVIDANAEKLFPKEVIKRLRKDYDTIVVKAAAPTIKYDIEVARDLKGLFPGAKVILTGHAAKMLKNWIHANVPEIDEVAEKPVENYIYQLVYGKSEPVSFDEFPAPDYSLFPYQNYTEFDGLVRLSLYTSRGCSMGCEYCPYTAFYDRKLESRSLENVIQDIKSVLSLGVKTIQFRDQFFSFNRKRVITLCNRIIEENLGFKWRCETRLETLDTELIDLMAKAGLEEISFGIESANKEMLESFSRRPLANYENTKSLIEYLHQKNIRTCGFYIIGFPDEDWYAIEKTYNLATHLRTNFVKFSIYSPCVLNDKNDRPIEITPDFFVLFENLVNVNPSKHLTVDALKFAVDQMTLMYYALQYDFKGIYDVHYIYPKKYAKTVREFQKKLQSSPLLAI